MVYVRSNVYYKRRVFCRQNKCTEDRAQTNPARSPIECMIEKVRIIESMKINDFSMKQ